MYVLPLQIIDRHCICMHKHTFNTNIHGWTSLCTYRQTMDLVLQRLQRSLSLRLFHLCINIVSQFSLQSTIRKRQSTPFVDDLLHFQVHMHTYTCMYYTCTCVVHVTICNLQIACIAHSENIHNFSATCTCNIGTSVCRYSALVASSPGFPASFSGYLP